MTLINFQTALGRLLREQNKENLLPGLDLGENERLYFEDLSDTAGFRLYAGIQRSWCIGRAAKSAPLTLSILPDDQRRRFLEEWVDAGGGTQSFYEVEAESFFDFISQRLIDPSHELTVCEFERAAQRASLGTNSLGTPELLNLERPDCRLRRGRYAGLVRFHADPGGLLESLQRRQPLPPVSAEALVVMFSPGLPQLWTTPGDEELALWQALESPASVGTLLANGHSLESLRTLLIQSSIEYAE